MKRRVRNTLFLAGMLLCGVGIFGIAGRRENLTVPAYVLTYAENQTEDYPTTRAAERFAEMVYEQTGGMVEIQVHAGSSLGDEMSMVEQLQFGGIDFARVSLSNLANELPKLNVLQMPYLYTSSEHMWDVLDGELGEEFMEAFSGSNMVPLSWYDAGSRCFYTTKNPVQSLEDLKGLRIRVPDSELMRDMITSMGAVPVPEAYEQVYSSLETGKIDGAENNWPSYEAMGHNEVARYYTVDDHMRIPEAQLVSAQTWEKLPKEYQEVIRRCAQESAEYERRLWKEEERLAKSRVIAEGCIVIELSQEEKESFREAVLPLYEKYCPEYLGLVEQIIALGEEEK